MLALEIEVQHVLVPLKPRNFQPSIRRTVQTITQIILNQIIQNLQSFVITANAKITQRMNAENEKLKNGDLPSLNDTSYVITPQGQPLPIPEIVITPSTDVLEQLTETSDQSNQNIRNNQSQKTDICVTDEKLYSPVITSQIYDENHEIKADIAATSCLYVEAEHSV